MNLNPRQQRQFTASDVERLNQVISRLAAGTFTLMGRECRYELEWQSHGVGVAGKTDQVVFLEWGGAHFELRLPGELAARLYHHALGEEPPLTLPAPLLSALMDQALDGPVSHLETISGRKLRFIPQRPNADLRFAFQVLLESAGKELVVITILTESAGLALLLLLARRAPDPAPAALPDDFPIVVRLEVGDCDLDYGSLSRLAAFDVIVLDHAAAKPLQDSPLILARCGVTGQFRAQLKDHTLVVMSPLEQAMPEHIDPAASSAPL
jgi:hypothetical protein